MRALWLSLDGEQREIAEKTSIIVNVDNIKSVDGPTKATGDLQYHRNCYSKFTNVRWSY